jgi:hypothetical protein
MGYDSHQKSVLLMSIVPHHERLTSYHFMDNENEQPQVEEETPVVEETTEEIEKPVETPKEEDTVLLRKSDYVKLNRKAIAYEANKNKPIDVKSLDVEDYIDISASLEGLDQKEKEFLAREHKLSGQPLAEIRKNEDFLLWQSAYRQKVEKERLTLKPSSTQPESEIPKTLHEKLKGASLEEKEKILTEAGYYKSPRPIGERKNIGVGMRY